jgi:hypothetical protein
MVLLSLVKLTNLTAQSREVPVQFAHRRQFAPYPKVDFRLKRTGAAWLLEETGNDRALLAVTAPDVTLLGAVNDYQREERRADLTVLVTLPPNGSRDFSIHLPSAPVAGAQARKLAALQYAAARGETIRFWSEWLSRGATFEVPDKVVNELFRASLWHSLRLPRRHGGASPSARIDLPYSNFAYAQTGTPWPVNQAVYVDNGIYDLRGYHQVSAEEIGAQFQRNQEANGHITGFANWVSYTPGMLYAVSRNYRLSGDNQAFERLLPQTLLAADWMVAQLQSEAAELPWTRGLVHGPLNDGTGEGYWAFNQAYVAAALEELGAALRRHGHPRAQEFLAAASRTRAGIERAWGYASARSPLVQLRDHTWIPYVPTEATHFRRMLDIWYPSEVDTGAVHLLRLGVIPPHHWLADSLLNDHEDNLFYRGLGIANEPVYNQQAFAYLLRDDPKAVVRAFYSYMASAFSHTVFEPVEHRFTHGQYFGPPSTDGAWFELYRNMLVRETADGGLFLGQAVPRRWLEPGRKITVQRAPTEFGEVSFLIEPKSAAQIEVTIQPPRREPPAYLLVRLRHPQGKPLRAVTLNGARHSDFDAGEEWIRVSRAALAAPVHIQASY